MGTRQMNGVYFNYDNENDVLYFHFEKPKEAVSVEIADGVFARLDPNTDEVVGFTILDLRKKTLEERGIQMLPTDKNLIEANT